MATGISLHNTLVDTQDTEDLIGKSFDDVDEATDAIFEAMQSDANLKSMFSDFLSQESVFNFVSAVDGFYANGGGKCYVYLMGAKDVGTSLRENQADKLGLFAFDDVDDIALMAAPGTAPHQQKEMLEYCEIRKRSICSVGWSSFLLVIWIFQLRRKDTVQCMYLGSK